VFWGSEKKISSADFEGGNINCLFGGVEYDLSKVKIDKNGAEMNISVIFGGVELRVPENIEVISNITAILGGVEDKTETTGTP
ncbi:MAG TPA: LiaF-related protein, partial [Candidatus Dojkabacteria bacterium]|nr:LiaF-related protein [Candidatus Dojkabacteria bacterium]